MTGHSLGSTITGGYHAHQRLEVSWGADPDVGVTLTEDHFRLLNQVKHGGVASFLMFRIRLSCDTGVG